jgi:hypothetical protein
MMMSAAQILMGLGMAAAVGLKLHAIGGALDLLSFWVAVPFLIMVWASFSHWLNPVSPLVMLVGAILLAASAAGIYQPAVVFSSSTGVLVFLSLPLYQTGAAIAVIIVAHLRGGDRPNHVPKQTTRMKK